MIQHYALPNGVELETLHQGETPQLLFLHGFGDSYYIWTPLLAHLPQDALAVSLRGFGGSSPQPPYTLEAFAEDVLHLLDLLAIDTISVVGHSLGSLVAQHLASAYPQRVSKLVLIGSGVRSQTKTVWALRAATLGRKGKIPLPFIEAMQATSQRPNYPPALMAEIACESSRATFEVWRSVLTTLAQDDASERLTHIQVPTLVLWGDEDTVFTRAQQDALLAALPHAQLEVLAGLGHSPFLEAPACVAEHITRFVACVAEG